MAQLPTRKIDIDEDDLRDLKNNPWSKSFKPITIAIDGKDYSGTCGIRGGHTRNYNKKSFEIRLDGGKTLHWNAEFDDPSMIRNALSFQFFNGIGVPSPDTQHISVEINGYPQGVYLEIEAVDKRFFKKRGIGYNSLIYAVNDNADFSLVDQSTSIKKNSLFDGYELVTGQTNTKYRLVRFIRNINTLRAKQLNVYAAKRLDINQYLLWLAGAVLTGNYDGFDQNYALYEHKKTSKYRIIPWDYEGTWGRNCYGKPCGSDLVRLEGYNKLTSKLFTYSSCRLRYRRIMQNLLKTAFTVERIDPIISQLYKEITPAIRDDFTRKSSYDTFLDEPSFILDYIRERRGLIKEALKAWK
ncbi:CotH kinase family protein [Paenibacillus glycanilyticus]|uniref:Spore coat protein H n=1 Tax=Paenibacillus glycanilyticus TaxID=126569 RepID=A0ABQ6GDI1_9BACL|nr:CotH kinase family protein [Paenibacillus glycanilyticus]GLX67132.1 spore coat protein H [Paenibacillus glycanilyticus]